MKEQLRELRIDAGLLLAGVASFLVTSWWATQDLAHTVAYSTNLGPPWFRLGSYPVYRPFTFFAWDIFCRLAGSPIFQKGWCLIFAGAAGAAVCLSLVGLRPRSWNAYRERAAGLLCLGPGAASVFAGLWISTQAMAKLAGYRSSLRAPWFVWHGYPVYRPYAFLAWYARYAEEAPRTCSQAGYYLIMGLAVGFCLTAYFWKKRSASCSKLTSHGTARWAGRRDLVQSRLTDNDGVVLGKAKSGVRLCHGTEEHVLLLAPPRTGKGVGVIVPTLFTWPHSVVITDIKGENWGITAGFRKKGLNNVVLRFDPTAEAGGVRFNPLEEIRVGTLREVADTQNIADILVNPYGEPNQSHWDRTGYDLLVGTILHILHSPEIKEKNLATLALMLSDPERSFDDTLKAMLTARHDPELRRGWRTASGKPTATHPVVASAARAMLDKAEGERSGVKSTALATLALYRDPLVALNTSCSDFRITDLMNHDKPVSLYMVIPTSEICRTRPLYRMIMNMLGRKLTEKMDFENGRQVVRYRHRLLLLLDEFQSLGQLDFFEASLAFIAGYGIKALLVVQNPEQIKKYYGTHTSIFSNCGVRVVYTPNDIDEAEQISRALGERTELVTNTSLSDSGKGLWSRNTTTSTQEIGRRLMTAREIAELPEDEEIIFVAGHPPIKADKIRYYQDRRFKGMVRAAPAVSDLCQAASEGTAAVRAAVQVVEAEVVVKAKMKPVAVQAPVEAVFEPAAPMIAAGKGPAARERTHGEEEMPEWARRVVADQAKAKAKNSTPNDDGTGGVTL